MTDMTAEIRRAIQDCYAKSRHRFIKNHGAERCVHCGVSVQDWDKIQTELATQTMWNHI